VRGTDSSDKIILDLCGGTGSWSKPYKEAGYDVRLITLPDNDVLTYEPPEGVYGILAAPPCTDFSVSGAQYWKAKDQDGRTIQSMSVVIACLKIIALCHPKFWALENPIGRLKHWMGSPQLKFNPCDYGDAWTKKTYLWGNFSELIKAPVISVSNSDQHNCISWPRDENGKTISWNTPKAKEIRSITPSGFAQAFFKANQ
jgi:hypothetical protein